MCVDLRRGQIACKIVISYYYIISTFYVYSVSKYYMQTTSSDTIVRKVF